MCSRYETMSDDELARAVAVGDIRAIVEKFERSKRRDVYPRQFAPVLRIVNGQLIAEQMHWSLIPFWLKDTTPDGRPRLKMNTHNARADRIVDAPTFRGPWKRSQRCLIPLAAWYEPRRGIGQKGWLRISASVPVMMFAGIWDTWHSPGVAEPVRSFSIITTEPAPSIAQVHDRMPVRIVESQRAAWLDESTPADTVIGMLQPVEDDYTVEPARAA
ncbi:MAG: SOS response-associated peptidase family protein [Dokdonella sp.]